MNKNSFSASHEGNLVVVLKNSARLIGSKVTVSVGNKKHGRVKNVRSANIDRLTMDENKKEGIKKMVLKKHRKNNGNEKVKTKTRIS